MVLPVSCFSGGQSAPTELPLNGEDAAPQLQELGSQQKVSSGPALSFNTEIILRLFHFLYKNKGLDLIK